MTDRHADSRKPAAGDALNARRLLGIVPGRGRLRERWFLAAHATAVCE